MIVQLMNAGLAYLQAAQLGGPLAVPASYQVGADAGFTPNPAATGVTSPVFTGSNTTIRYTKVNANEIILTCYFPYDLELVIGNIMIKLAGGQPFLWMVNSKPFHKVDIDEDKYYSGDIYFQSMVLKYPNIAALVNNAGLPDFYAQAPRFEDTGVMPETVAENAEQVFIEQPTRQIFHRGRPIYVTQVNGRWMGVNLLTRRIDDERFGEIDGGVAGDSYIYS